MNNPHDDRFDDWLRARHAAALSAVSPRVRAQLAVRRGAASVAPARRLPRALGWTLATATAAGVLAIGLQWSAPAPEDGPAATAATQADAAVEATYATLDESPDLYLWLASSEATTLAME